MEHNVAFLGKGMHQTRLKTILKCSHKYWPRFDANFLEGSAPWRCGICILIFVYVQMFATFFVSWTVEILSMGIEVTWMMMLAKSCSGKSFSIQSLAKLDIVKSLLEQTTTKWSTCLKESIWWFESIYDGIKWTK